MIIGSGFVANTFNDHYAKRHDVCLYAAGVSNSMCTDTSDFARDKNLLCESLKRSSGFDKFIYISTCSTQDPSMDTMYVHHKREMESLVMEVANCLVIRLPQIAGLNKNPYTILNAFYNAILKKQEILILRNAYRNIIDIDDVVAIVAEILPKAGNIKSINVANPISTSVMNIVTTLEDVLEEKAVVSISDGGSPFDIDVSVMASMANISKYRFNEYYLKYVLSKYYTPSP